MKLRLRSLETKETLRVEVPSPCSLQGLKETLARVISSSSSSSNLHLSLNRKDEIQASSPEESLQSLGIAAGDNSDKGIHESESLGTPNQKLTIQARKKETSDIDMSDVLPEEGALVLDHRIEEKKEFCGTESMDIVEGSVEMVGKKSSEPCFLRRVLREELGEEVSDQKLLAIAVHAVILDSGFVGLDSLSSKKNGRFHFPSDWPAVSSTLSLRYTLPVILYDGSGANESVCLKFQSLGHFVNIYGSLSNGGLGLYRVCLDKSKFARTIDLMRANSDSKNSMENRDDYPEHEVFEFWKIVKDGLALPLLIDICEKAGLGPPPCFMRLPTELKLKFLENLPGTDLAKVGCTCSELRYLSSSNDLWKQKFEEEFGHGSGAKGSTYWKELFVRYLETKKKSERALAIIPRYRPETLYFPVRRDPNPFGVPSIVGGDYDRLPGFGVPSPFRRPGMPFPRFQQRRNFSPGCNLGGFSS
ncbi:F-box protein SKIP22-like [Quillaja saponaria]|uniref:F-box protein SKIP22-like n=1 Tax=Quillaja saponaria TaxID=32244 RepID=A0AAD7M223_QUISA|nr:F-box protein SKIP22-like [Quillaja saponaria]KAJ7967606.1 F-box protein SKIP22-like [Quillaja saponaria]